MRSAEMFESREDPIEFLTAAETGRASPAADQLRMTRSVLPRNFATLEQRLRKPPSRQGRRPVPDSGRPLFPTFLQCTSVRADGKAMRAAPAPRLPRSALDLLQ